ncbi:Autophagy protein 7 [Cryptotrichosporon argae]
MPPLQFQPLSSQPTPAFWSALTSLKLDTLKLDDAARPVAAWLDAGRVVDDVDRLTGRRGGDVGVDGALGLGGDAFEDDERIPPGAIRVTGTFKNFNTIEEFRKTETKRAVFDGVVERILASFDSDEPDPNPFLLVTFADLKKYTYHYWFAFPALVAKPAWETGEWAAADDADAAQIAQLAAGQAAVLVKGAPGQRVVGKLSDASTFFAGVPDEDRHVAFHDPSAAPSHPGWPLRNVLFYLCAKHNIASIGVLALRAPGASRTARVSVAGPTDGEVKAVGWERNNAGKLASRFVDLGGVMDPARLADQAVDLNLKLMRWRIMPSLDLDKIAETRCLLLGAGTIGCYVARALMGWGIRTITFVDSARVSFSNPVRQPLFDFEDCLDGGKPKAQCAADRLKKIFPGVSATAHSFMIPMPGHPSSDAGALAADVAQLDALVDAHDAVFLLMDSRESRWLPTVMGAAKAKVVINAALGFDSYLVMRHGAGGDAEVPPQAGKRLGCYYCNDIVAPADSLTDRTLDQMCTVTRPGVAPIAAASAVEMLVSLVQHPLGIHAPAEGSPNVPPPAEGEGSPLGAVPHQMRGALGQWKTMLIEGAAYDRCTGCSKTVIDAYRKDAAGLVHRACNEPDYLQKLTGLDKLYEEGEAVLDSVDWEEGSGDDDF